MSSVSLMPGKRQWKTWLKVQDQNQIPELNVYQCGTYQMHSLQEAQDIARNILERDVRINSNEELALPKEKLQELHI